VKALRGFGHFWYDFLIGDDWTIAAAVVVAVAITALVADAFSAAWVIVPCAVVAVLGVSLWHATRPRSTRPR
jgi:hypothetical protein